MIDKIKRDKPIVVKVSKEEAELAHAEANRLGLSISAYIRLLIHKEENVKGEAASTHVIIPAGD